MDTRYNFSLKDYVFNTNNIVKGKVIGTRSFIDNNIVRSEVKLVVEDSLMGTLKKGEIFTFVATGGVITEYEFWKMNGNKFKLSNNELEKAKKKLVIADVLSTLIYPEDEMYVFVGKDKLTISSTNEQVPWVSFQIKYTGEKINTTTNFEDQTTYYAQELRAMNSVEELNSLLKKMILEKKGYSQEKARDTAYNEVSKNDRAMLDGRESANVTYLSKGTYISGVRSEPDLIEVTFTGKPPIAVYLKDRTYEVYQIIKGQ